MVAVGMGDVGETENPLSDVERISALVWDGVVRGVARARHGVLEPYLHPQHKAIGSINSPMQCMMKEICAQCLQQHKDPKTGEETGVSSPVLGSLCCCRHCAQISFIMHCTGELILPIALCCGCR